jgi:hypothetical protein
MAASSFPLLRTVHEGLNFRTVDQLKKLLALLPTAEAPTRKADLISVVERQLQGPNLKKLWANLDKLQQAAVAEAVYSSEPHFRADQFAAKYGDLPEWHSSNVFYRYNEPAAKLDLFFYSLSQYGDNTILPEDLRQALKAFVPEPPPLALASTDQLDETLKLVYRRFDYKARQRVEEERAVPLRFNLREQAAQQDLLAVLRLVHLGKVSVSDKTLMPSKITLQAIAPLLQTGDYYGDPDASDKTNPDDLGPMQPFAWVMLLQGGGLAKANGKKLELTKAGQKAMSAPPAKTLQAIWKKWQKTTVLDELRRVEAIKGQTGKAKRSLTAVSGRRLAIAQLVSQCPVGAWVTCGDLKRYMIASDQTFDVSRNPDTLSIDEYGYRYLFETGGAQRLLQEVYLKCLLFEYMATLGLLDIAYLAPDDVLPEDFDDDFFVAPSGFLSRYDGLHAIRLTPLGAYCLGLANDYIPAPITTDSTLRVLPNLDIVMTGAPLTPAEKLMMETFTESTSEAVWKLNREVALKAVEDGHPLSEFYTFLKEASADALPKTVEQFFRDCRDRSASLQDRGVARLIECQDATLAALIANDSRTKKYCQLAGDQYLVVPLDQETRFRSGLRKLGYSLPLSHG